jgi:hypothetical protein
MKKMQNANKINCNTEVIMNLKRRCAKKRIILLLLFLTSSFLLPASCLNAAFEETSVGGRPTAMGGAYVGLADDVYSVYHNPAGLALMSQAEFAAQYSRLFVGLTDNSNLNQSFMAIARPMKFNRDYGTLGAGWIRFDLSGLYQENTFILSYAKYGLLPNLSVGINIKYLRLMYGQDDYTMNALDVNGNATGVPDSLFTTYGNSLGKIDFDFGLQYKLSHNYRMGLMVSNITEPNLALETGVVASLPRVYKLGFAHIGPTYAIAIDAMTKTFNQTSDWEVDAGAEKSFKFGMALRGGLAIGSRELANVTAGLGYVVDNFRIDYALVYPLSGVSGTMGNHRFSLTTRFGPVIRTFTDNAELTAKLEKEKALRIKVEKELEESKKQVEQLRGEIEALLKRPAAAVSPMPGIPETPAPAQKAKPVTVTGKKPSGPVTTTGYIEEMNNYKKNGNQMTIPKRIDFLKNVLDTYKDKVNTLEAESEYAVMVGELKAQKKYYLDSLTYYRKMVDQGINRDEQISILKKMVTKYESIGIDVSEAKRELGKVQGQ